LTKRAEAQKTEEKGSEEDRDCDGKITLRHGKSERRMENKRTTFHPI